MKKNTENFPALPAGLRVTHELFRAAFPFQFITHYTAEYSYADSTRLALEGGCRWIQLRMKEATPDEIRQVASVVEPMCRKYGAVFLIDDHVELVRELHADGVHLGKNDMPIAEARRVLGDTYILGGTANTFEDVQAHAAQGATYVGCGPFRFTATKKNLSPVLGTEGYTAICRKMVQSRLSLPVVAIGGITAADIPEVWSTGVQGIALSGTILQAADPVGEARYIRTLLESRL